MTYHERENLKSFAGRLEAAGDVRALADTLTLIAHWLWQCEPVSFTDYAASWLAARAGHDIHGPNVSPAMLAEWPLRGPPRIAPGGSDWVTSEAARG